MRIATLLAALVLTSACGRAGDHRQSRDEGAAPAPSPAPAEQPATGGSAATQPAPPIPRGSLPEPKGPIDPKSLEAAGQVVQHYGALIEQKRWDEAEGLWGDGQSAAKFARQLGPEAMHLQIGDLGEMGAAAGSIYTTIPVVFYREGFRRPADVILRRVNDVPGSTDAQRRWHIERIELKGA